MNLAYEVEVREGPKKRTTGQLAALQHTQQPVPGNMGTSLAMIDRTYGH